MSSSKLFFVARTPLNYALLGLCCYPIINFFWVLLFADDYSLVYLSVDMMGTFIAFIGALLFLNGRRLIGFVFQLIHLSAYVLLKTNHGREPLVELPFWRGISRHNGICVWDSEGEAQ